MSLKHVSRSRVVRQAPILYVNEATMIPDGMHGYHDEGWRTATMIPDGMHAYSVHDDDSFATEPVVAKLVVNGMPAEQARTLVYGVARRIQSGDSGLGIQQIIDKPDILDGVFQGLVARGVNPDRARILVHRAAARHQGLSGLGDDASDAASAAVDRLATISASAKTTQATHQSMITSMADWETREPGWVTTDDQLRLTFQNQLTALENQFVTQALPVLGVEFPYQIDRTDPAGAIVLAVRDDIQNTIDLLDARKSQQVLQKNISDLSKVPLPSAGPSFKLNLPDVPWYVWAGGAGVGLLALKQMLK